MKLCCTILIATAFAFVFDNVISSPTDNVLTNADELAQRRELLRNMTKEAWQAYVREVMTPEFDSEHFWYRFKNTLITHIMSTLWTMGLKEEFAQGREWIGTNFVNFSHSEQEDPVRIRLCMNEVLSGLLSCYALTNDTMFRDKAFDIASALPAYVNQTEATNSIFVPKIGERKLYDYYGPSENGVSELGAHYLNTLAPEKFVDRTSMWKVFLQNHTDSSNFSNQTKNFPNTYSLTMADNAQFYSNLVRMYAQSNGTNLETIEMFVKAIEAAAQLEMITTTVNGLSYIREYKLDTKQLDNFMYHRACNFGAVLRISADALEAMRESGQTIASKTNHQQLSDIIAQHRALANQITETCHSAVSQTVSKMLPIRLYIDEQDRVENRNSTWSNQIVEHSLVESYLVLWRATKKPKYRDYAWELAQAYKRNFRGNELNYVTNACALQYLYLIFSEDTVLLSKQWVFTPYGHPLPILSK